MYILISIFQLKTDNIINISYLSDCIRVSVRAVRRENKHRQLTGHNTGRVARRITGRWLTRRGVPYKGSLL